MKWSAGIVRHWSAAAAALSICAFYVSCTTNSSSSSALAKAASNGKVFAVTADKTSFFRYGPQQGNGADQELPRDTLMTLIRPSFGYSKVQLVTGSQEGYVASEDIRPASPTLLASLNPTPPPAPVSSSSGGGSENFDVRSADPNYVPPPETLPDPDLPPSSSDPSPAPSPQ